MKVYVFPEDWSKWMKSHGNDSSNNDSYLALFIVWSLYTIHILVLHIKTSLPDYRNRT